MRVACVGRIVMHVFSADELSTARLPYNRYYSYKYKNSIFGLGTCCLLSNGESATKDSTSEIQEAEKVE